MDKDLLQETAEALRQRWELQLPDVISEEAILERLTQRVIQLLEQGPESFFQLMYRLDISEKKLNGVLHEDDVAEQIARLIYDRQLQKIRTRAIFKSSATKVDPDLEW